MVVGGLSSWYTQWDIDQKYVSGVGREQNAWSHFIKYMIIGNSWSWKNKGKVSITTADDIRGEDTITVLYMDKTEQIR